MNVEDVVSRHLRVRRSSLKGVKGDSIDHVTKIMESIEEELDDLRVRPVDYASKITVYSGSASNSM